MGILSSVINAGSTIATNASNAAEAQKNRDYLTEMSNTSHQREVEDLKSAGLNPILSANSAGASTPSSPIATMQPVKTDVDLGKTANSALDAKNKYNQNEVIKLQAKQAQSAIDFQNEQTRKLQIENDVQEPLKAIKTDLADDAETGYHWLKKQGVKGYKKVAEFVTGHMQSGNSAESQDSQVPSAPALNRKQQRKKMHSTPIKNPLIKETNHSIMKKRGVQ